MPDEKLLKELETLRARVAKLEENEAQLKDAQETEHHRIIELEILRQASLSLTASLDLETILRIILVYTLQLVEGDNAHIFTYDGQKLAFGGALWAGKQQQEPFANPRENGLTYNVARSGKSIVVHDMQDHPLFRDTNWQGSIIGLPLCVENSVCGVMTVALAEPRGFREGEIHILELLADHAAIAIQNARYVMQVEKEIKERKLVEKALRDSEARYRSLFEHSPISLREEDWSAVKRYVDNLREKGISDFIKYFRHQSAELSEYVRLIKILDINQATLKLYEVEEKTQLDADDGSGLFYDRTTWDLLQNGITALIKGQHYFEAETVEHTVTGKTLHTLVSLVVAPKYTHNWAKILISSVDITKRKEAEAQALILEKERIRTDTLYKLIQAITHDLRTPLTTISTSLYLLKEPVDETRYQHHLKVIDTQIMHLSDVIDSILTMAHLDTVQMLSFSPVDLNRALREIEVHVETLARAKGIMIELQDGSNELMVLANESELHTALREIVKNAIQFTLPDGQVRVKTTQETTFALVSVEDKGIGMSPEVMTRVFERFYRADDSRSTNGGGAGLGLSIAQKIIDLHHGKIEIESQLEVGTTVRVWIPLIRR
ncbi:MAG: GAF domain-containing sensor histidine kinase [Chloroflexi bacterium]|nr:GAF domain-containing sensor histidine kinase [Chloroflexota bacterium]